MVVVHDDDLARIQGDYQPDALMSHLQSTKPVIHRVLCDCPSTNEGKSTTVTVTAATLSDAFQKRVPRALSASPVRALRLGVKRPGYGKAGRRIRVYSNLVEAKLRVNQGILHHYDVAILPSDENRSIAQNHQIIDALQTQVEGRLSVQPGVYDGRKNLFTSFDLELESGCRKYVVPVDIPSLVKGDTPTQKFSVCLTHVASIDPEVLNRFVRGEQGHDNVVLTAMMALNVVVRMGPSMKYPFNNRSFFTGQEIRPIGGGIVLWRGYFQSLRPAIDRMLINVNTSTSAMYRPGRLMDLALEFLNKPGRPDALEPRHGLLDDERLRLQEFVLGIRVIAPPRTSDPDAKRLIQKLTRQSSRERKFNIGDGQIMTVAQYFQDLLNIPLQYPDVICVELSTHAIIPLELCEVLPGQLARKQMSPDKTRSMLDFSTMHPRERMRSIRDGIGVLQYGQSEYVRQFGMAVSNELVGLDGRIIKPPTLKYNPESGRSSVQPRNGTWNLIDKYMFRPAEIPNWIVLIYENEQRFGQQAASQVITDLVRACEAVGITTNPLPAVVKWESGQGNVGHQLRAACDECQQITKAPPTLIAVILPDGGTDIYTAVKHFGDVSAGIATQCMKASKCFNAGPQYYASLTLKINVKLGGTNAVPEPKDVSFLTDPTNPTIVMGAHITHPPLESQDRPSFTSIIGSVDSSGVRYVSRMGVQASRRVVIEDMENMCVHVFEQFRDAMNKFPKRILFYRDGVPEGEFKTIINEELLLIRNACTKLGFNPAITLIIVGKGHKIVFFPDSARDADRSANCPPGMVVDTGVVSPAEFDYFLYGHAGLLGTSKPAHYTVLIDENEFTPDDLQSISFALCHLYARCTRSISVPAPVYYARNVCTRAKTHYDPQQRRRLFEPDTATETTDAPGSETTKDISGELREGFQQTHERMAKMMYFC
ncbi:argonaute-like protein [Russula compacta]|nr:argonaute-like protein [Russula compacta]